MTLKTSLGVLRYNNRMQKLFDDCIRLKYQHKQPCEQCGKMALLHKVKYADETSIGSMMVCGQCD